MKSALLSWQLWALLSASFAALTAIFAKVSLLNFPTPPRARKILAGRPAESGMRLLAVCDHRANAAFELGTNFVVMATAPLRIVVCGLTLAVSILTGVARAFFH